MGYRITFLTAWLFSLLAITGCEQKQITKLPVEDPVVTDQREEYLNQDFGLLQKNNENPMRESWQNPDLVVEKLGDLSGKHVADIGVGTGYFTFKIVNEAEKVLAIDVENRFLEYIEDRKFELGATSPDAMQRIETRLCQSDNPSLEPEEVDLVLMVNTYHFIEKRTDYLEKVRKGLREKGQLLLVDFKLGQMPVGPPEEVKVSLTTAIIELNSAGFTVNEVDTISLQFQYMIKAEK